MGNITLIAAIGKNRELGYKNDLIWRIPEDLKFFRENTIGKYIVMGMNTFNSLPKVLSNRKYVVLTHRNVDLGSSIFVFHNVGKLLEFIDKTDDEVMIIGGAQMYSLMVGYADKMLITEIDDSKEADVYFPEFYDSDWDRELLSNHNYEDLEYSHVMYKRKKK